MTQRARFVIVALAFTFVGMALAGLGPRSSVTPPAQANPDPQTRDYFLDMREADLDMGSATWHAWTFNGTVPGPTLTADVGDRIRVHVHNAMNLTHSFHTHLSPYGLENDGSQLNTITGIGGMAMIPPGGDYTYDFVATVPGLLYYHCHSADGGHTIHEHIAQGLYGAIIVKAVGEAPVEDQVVFMSERGFNVSSPDAPFYVMNGKGIPGGEHTLEQIFVKQGVPGVVAQLDKTVPVIPGRVGVPVRINVVNIGDMVHSFHMHGMTAYRDDGTPVPAQVLGLLPGEADRFTVTPTQPGLWLFHCHVVSHADGGMIGVFVVQPRTGQLDLPPAAHEMADMPGMESPSAPSNAATITASVGSGGELSFSPATLSLPSGAALTFVNGGHVPHSLTIPALGLDTGEVPPGASRTIALPEGKPGTYAFICKVPGHAEGGMRGSLTLA